MPDMEVDDRGNDDDYYLELSPDPIRFESVSCLTNVFFDDSKQQVSRFSQSFKNLFLISYNYKQFVYRCSLFVQEVLQECLLRVRIRT